MKIKISILSMLLLSIFVFLFNSNKVYAATTDVYITNVDELANAILNQADDQVWHIAAGEYDLLKTHLDTYASIQVVGETPTPRTGWYFPIVASIEIIGEGNPLITSSYVTPNGILQSQSFIAVDADNVKISGVNIKSKIEVNKAISVYGKNFELRNTTILPVTINDGTRTGVYGGSIYFISTDGLEDMGNVVLDNIYMHGGIVTYNQGTRFELTNGIFNDITIDSTNAYYNTFTLSSYMTADATNITFIINDVLSDYQRQVFDKLPENGTIILSGDVILDKSISISKNVTIIGNNHKITASDSFTNVDLDPIKDNLFNINLLDNVTFKDVIIETSSLNSNAINIIDSNVTLDNVTINHTLAASGSAVEVQGSNITVNGVLDIILGTKSDSAFNINNNISQSNTTFEFINASDIQFTTPDITKTKFLLVDPASLQKVVVNNLTKMSNTYLLHYENYDVNEAALFNDTYHLYGEPYTLLTPMIYGYTFLGWYDNSAFKGPIIDVLTTYIMPNTDISLYAKFIPNDITVNFKSENATYEFNLQYDQVIDLSKLPTPTYDKHRFIGWNSKADGSGIMLKDGAKLTDITNYYAIWEIEYTLILDYTKSKKTNETYNLIASDSINLLVPELSGYKFIGWNTHVDGQGTYIPIDREYSITEDTTLYAQWEQIIVTNDKETNSLPTTGSSISYLLLTSLCVAGLSLILVSRKAKRKS